MTIRHQANSLISLKIEEDNELSSFCYHITCSPISWSFKRSKSGFMPVTFLFYINGQSITVMMDSDNTTAKIIENNDWKAKILGYSYPYAILFWLHEQYPGEDYFNHPERLSGLFIDESRYY